MRDYLRMYEDLRGDLRICKQRVLHFLLRRGIRYDQGGPWTVKHKNWLSSLEFSDPGIARPSTCTSRRSKR